MVKRYFYVDESGQDTQGKLFIVSVVVAVEQIEQWRNVCEEAEQVSRKGKRKWMKTIPDRCLAYMRLILQNPLIAGRLLFALYKENRDYDGLTAQTIATAVKQMGNDGKNVIIIDALPKEQWQGYSRRIRQAGAKIEKVRGVRRDENDAMIRLADAVCGFVRDASEGKTEMKALFETAITRGIIKDLAAM